VVYAALYVPPDKTRARAIVMTDKGTLNALNQVLTDGVDLEEFRDLCFRLDMDEDECSE
jgi:hypothetical protein